MSQTFLQNIRSLLFHSRLRLHRKFTRKMGSIISCGKTGSVTISSSNLPANLQDKRSTSHQSGESDVVEKVVCSELDLPSEGLKSCELDGVKILLAKSGGIVHALGSKCTHYNLPLENGSLCNGRLRCPFHGACFSIETGDIEDFPGRDSLPKFDVTIANGEVKVRARKSLLIAGKRVKEMVKRDPENPQTFVIVGAGAAGSSCAETLRQEGFSGRVLVLGSEAAAPYDRPKLSKAMHLSVEAISLRNPAFYENADIELKLDSPVSKVDTTLKTLSTASGEEFSFTKLFIATGVRARALSVPGSDLKGVFVLQTFSDAHAIVHWAKGKKVVIIGSSFIGMEAAAYLSTEERCESVTVIGRQSVPFLRTLGSDVGLRIQTLFEQKGVAFINNADVTKVEGEEMVEKVIVNDEIEVPADMVIAGIGTEPSTECLATSDVIMDSRGFVPVDETMATNVENVYCGGDVCAFPLFLQPESRISIGHWQMANMHGHVAALNMVATAGRVPLRSVPFFWTVLYGKSLRYAGYGAFDDVVISGDLENLTFIAYYCQGSKVVGVGSLGRDPAAANYANYLYNGSFLTKEQVMQDGDAVMHLKC